jgi:hypothetical protein
LTDLGGGCGGGTLSAVCANRGNQNFALRLYGAAASVPASLMLSASRATLACGPCTIVPDLATSIAFNSITNQQGSAAVMVPIPNSAGLAGAALLAQWIVPGGGCFGLALSNGGSVGVR